MAKHPMAATQRRETFSSLRAARAAVRVARDLSAPPVDVSHVNCLNCGQELNWYEAESFLIACPACHSVNEVPVFLRAQIGPAPLASRVDNVLDYSTGKVAPRAPIIDESLCSGPPSRVFLHVMLFVGLLVLILTDLFAWRVL